MLGIFAGGRTVNTEKRQTTSTDDQRAQLGHASSGSTARRSVKSDPHRRPNSRAKCLAANHRQTFLCTCEPVCFTSLLKTNNAMHQSQRVLPKIKIRQSDNMKTGASGALYQGPCGKYILASAGDSQRLPEMEDVEVVLYAGSLMKLLR
ncbi:hypothetical protein BaRGS_00008572 [Batillaria attramentaria]|uniref:Uncharacterized protein n=1 Tax=Batillaria attramentaria TaxID=370345 RepID=A0ABD0LKT2_9CAEN